VLTRTFAVCGRILLSQCSPVRISSSALPRENTAEAVLLVSGCPRLRPRDSEVLASQPPPSAFFRHHRFESSRTEVMITDYFVRSLGYRER
jgi:hypothetical protein